jgi:4-hydroxy-3-methylbut-2-enyl diphosphate reductase
LGDIVHNEMEVERLCAKGLKTINYEQFAELKNVRVLIRAHGEPPSTYRIALENNIELIDASCPVVLKLQNRVRSGFDIAENNQSQVVIYGKKGHAEVVGLVGQTQGNAIVVSDESDLDLIDYSKPIKLFSQTTKSKERLSKVFIQMKERADKAAGLSGAGVVEFNDTTCRQVSNREPELRLFAQRHDVVLFVSGRKSSNGITLHGVCKKVNDRSYFLTSPEELQADWIANAKSIGICGATSTPLWLMERIQAEVERRFAQDESTNFPETTIG